MRLAIAALLLLSSAPTPDAKYFRYQRSLHAAGPGQSCAALDPQIFTHSQPGLADLRVLRAGVQVPFAVWTSAAMPVPEQTTPLLNLGTQSGDTVFDAAMPPAGYRDIQLSVTGHDFIAKVAVTGKTGAAEQTGTSLGDFTIFDLTQQKLGRSTVLHLPESNFAVLHFRVSGPLTPQDFGGLTVGPQQAKQQRYVTVTESATATQKDHSTVYELSVPANVPVDRVLITPTGRLPNFSRQAEVAVSASPRERTTAAYEESGPRFTGTLLRVHTEQAGHKINEEQLTISTFAVPSASTAEWTVTIDNGDDAPVPLQSVALQMLERDICVGSGDDATLYYGDSALSAPRYDYAALFQHQEDAAASVLGPEQSNPLYQPRPDERPISERYPALLWFAIILVIALLAGIALRLARRTEV